MRIGQGFIGFALGTMLLGHFGTSHLRAQSSTTTKIVPVTLTSVATNVSTPERPLTVVDRFHSNGSLAKTATLPQSSALPRIYVVDTQAKRQYVKDTLLRAYDEAVLTESEYDRRILAPATCKTALPPGALCTPIGNETHLGYRVQKARMSDSRHPDDFVEVWLAPDLNFAQMKRLQFKAGIQVAEIQVINVLLGEPDAEFFELPADYKKYASSSQFLTDGEKLRGEDSGWTSETANRFDEMQRRKASIDSLQRVQ